MKKLFFFLAALTLSFTAQAAVVNAHPNGGEANVLSWFLSQANAGDTLLLADGEYIQPYSLTFDKKGLVVKAAEGAKPVIVLTHKDASMKPAVTTTFEGIAFECGDSVKYPVVLPDGDAPGTYTFRNCEFKNYTKFAISNPWGEGHSYHLDSLIVDGCLFHDGGAAVYLPKYGAVEGKDPCDYVAITNTTIYNITEPEYIGVIQVSSNGERQGAYNEVVIDHVTMYNFTAGGYGALGIRKSTNLKISNSIIANPTAGQYAFYLYGGTIDNTLYYNTTDDADATHTACLTVDPDFVDAANGNFALKEGSPALGAGTDGSNLGDPRWNAPAVEEPVYEVMELTMTDLEVQTYGEALGLWASDPDNGIEVMLFLDAEGKLMEEESSIATALGDYTVTGTVTKAYSEELETDVYTAELYAVIGETNFKLILTMYTIPAEPVEPTVVVVENATIEVTEQEVFGNVYTSLMVTGEWSDGETTYPVLVEIGSCDLTKAESEVDASVTVGSMGENAAWLGFADGLLTMTIADNVLTLKGVVENTWTTPQVFIDLTISGKLPVVEEPEVELPEPTYTENKLNTYAFGLESVLSDDKATLTVTYRLNNSNATSVNVVVYNGEEKVATIPGTTAIGVNTVEVATADLPCGVELTWAVEVNGTSVEAPTREEKIYSFYHPSGVDIDINPENETFGLLLVNEGMQSVASKTEGYVSAGFGAGIFAFTPSFDLIPNGDKPGTNGGIEFTNTRADGTGTAYAPRRIRISEDGRIFVTSLNTDGNYLWEVNPDNINEWTPIFKGTLNDQRELITEDSAFIAAPNAGFDVKGSGENLQLAMYSVNLSGITAAAMSGFRLHEYNLGTATEWATAPSKALVEGKYAINYTGTQVEYDNEGGFWIASYRGSATDANPGLVHINAEGVEDCKLVWNNVRQAGIRFNNDFTKLVVAGNNGAAKKATIYAVSKDANGAPVLTEETVVDMSAVGSNLNDFAWDYAGNLYSCGNNSEKLAAWALPYSGTVETPAAAKYAFQLPEPLKMAGVVKRAVQNGDEVVVLTHEADGTAHIYQVVDGKAIAELSQEGVIAVDPENAGDLLAISDIAVTEDGKLLAINKIVCQAGDAQVDEGYKRGETRVYIWNDLASAPSVWFTSKMSSNWYRSVQGHTMAYKGTSTNGTLFTTGVTATGVKFRYSVYNVIDGVYTEPAVNDSEHYHFTKGDAQTTDILGANYEINASLLAENTWVLDGELVDPFEITDPLTYNSQVTAGTTITEDLGKKYNGASYVTVGEQVLMVAPFATPDGKLTSVEILDITNGLDAAQYVDQLFIDEAVEATAAATAVEVVEGDEATALLITLVADATIYSLEATLAKGDNWEVYEDEITNLVIDLDNFVLIGGPSSAFQVDVYLGLGEYNRNDDTYQLLPESSIAVMGQDATFIEGYAYEVDAFTPSAKAVVRCMWNGMAYEFHLTMSAAPLEATKVVVENATIEIEKYLLFGDMYDYALKMTGEWVNPEDGLTYPVLVEVPVYYPEATEPSEITSTVTVGGWEDDDPWLGFGEGTLTVTTVGDIVTATGIVQNPLAGVAIDITISGKLSASEPTKYTVTATVNPAEAGTVTGAGEYEEGAEVTLTATAAEGYEFVNWTVAGEEVATTTDYTFTVTADVEVVANFITASAVDNIQVGVKAVKVVKNGQLVIIKGDVEYNAQGAVIK